MIVFFRFCDFPKGIPCGAFVVEGPRSGMGWVCWLLLPDSRMLLFLLCNVFVFLNIVQDT